MMHAMDHTAHDVPGHRSSLDDSSQLLQLLKRRYAQGEITLSEFEEARRVLGLIVEAPAGGRENP